MAQRINVDTVQKPVREFLRGLGTIREPVELVLQGTVVAKLIAPTELSDAETAALIARGRELVRRARGRNAGVPAQVIEREVRQAVDEVRRRKQR
jgi:hypothetical protein